MVDRRTFLFVLSLGALSAPLTAEAQQAGKVYRVGLLALLPAADATRQMKALKTRLRDLGYIEGENSYLSTARRKEGPNDWRRWQQSSSSWTSCHNRRRRNTDRADGETGDQHRSPTRRAPCAFRFTWSR